MADAPQGLFTFPGLNSIRSGSFTLSHGISPSAAVIEITPQNNFAVQGGTLEITYGGTAISFPDCRLDMASLTVGTDGRTWSLRVLDRRWKWEFGHISGSYNLRKPSGHINPATEKSPRELATLLLRGMGEYQFDVQQIPNETRPLVEWSYDNPAEQLQQLCDTLGCRVVLGIDNKVRICRLGNGANLPTDKVSTAGYGFDPPEMPDSLLFVAAPTKYQMKFVLEAVGLDTDGEVKLIKDLSFNPQGVGEVHGWANQQPDVLPALMGTDTLSEQKRQFALTTVFRWYRVKEPATLDWKVPWYGTIKSIKQILPLIPNLLTEETPLGERLPQSQQAYIEGKFYNSIGDPKTFVNTPRGTKYPGGFSIDSERGIVQFSDPVYRFVRCETNLEKNNSTDAIVHAGSYAYFPAELVLECVVNVHDYNDRHPERFTKEQRLTNQKFSTRPKVIKRDDVALTVRAQYQAAQSIAYGLSDASTIASATAPLTPYVQTNVVTNEKDTGLNGINSSGVKSIANYYIAEERATYLPKESLETSYSAIVPINPDGVIQQVSWSVGLSGATTKASKNSEFDLRLPSHSERRTLQILKAEKDRLKRGGKLDE